MGLKRFRSRLGLTGKKRERSLLFIASKAAAIEPLAGLIEAMTSRDSRLRIVLSSYDPQMLRWLGQRFPALLTLPLPYANRISAELYLRQLKIRTVAFVEDQTKETSRALLGAFTRLAIGVVTISGRTIKELPHQSALTTASEAVVLVGVGAGGQELPSGVTAMTAGELADMLGIMLARDLKALRETSIISRFAAAVPARLAASQRWRKAIAWRVRRYQNVVELRERLKSPRVILCMGNGPSSEDPKLKAMTYNAIFRVNHSWLKNNFLSSPDVVFTGGRPTMRVLSGTLFGLQSVEAEERLMVARTFHPLRGRTEFFNVNEMTSSLKQFDWGHLRPTNGASMLATAVALKPAKLIVAGIDLFQHPEGSYPGETSVPNAYAPMHSRETELEFMLLLFSSFDGEIVIVGNVLQAAWKKFAKGGHINA
jgi:hypothetical protein